MTVTQHPEILTPVTPYHDCPPREGHRCEPRIIATCADCGVTYAACTISDDAVRLLLLGAWNCRACSEGLTADVLVEAAADGSWRRFGRVE